MSFETGYIQGSDPFPEGDSSSSASREQSFSKSFRTTLQQSLQYPDLQFTQIRFQVVNRKTFRLKPEDAERSLLPIVLVGNKRRACNFINHLNNSSSEYRNSLKLNCGELIPFKMLDADSFPEFTMSSLNGRQIRLLCIYSEIFDQDVERKIRNKLKTIEEELDDLSSDNRFIKTVSTIYLRNVNSNLRITRVKHRRNTIETDLNYFKYRLKSYSELPEIGWRDIITMRVDSTRQLTSRQSTSQQPTSRQSTSQQSTSRQMCSICAQTHEFSERATYSCGHTSCLRCAGSIATISKKCPFCRAAVHLNNITISIRYIPSLFSSIKELLNDMIPNEKIGAQSVIYVQNELAIQHLYNFLIQSIEPLEDRMEILTPTFNFSLLAEGSPHHYFLACSNDLIPKLPNLTVIVTSTDDEYCKNLMLNFKSYGRNYGKTDQELIVLNAE
jgi:hypothetical protein